MPSPYTVPEARLTFSPSSKWTPESGLQVPWEASFVRDFVDSLNTQAIVDHANRLRGRTDATIRKDVFARGQENVVLEISFNDEEYWVARVQLPAKRPAPPYKYIHFHSNKMSAELVSEVQTMNHIRERTNIPIPTVYGFCTHEDNTVGANYILMSAVEGDLHFILPKVPDKYKEYVFEQYAHMVLDMSALQFPKIGLVTATEEGGDLIVNSSILEEFYRFPAFDTAQEYYINRAKHILRLRVKEDDEDKITWAWLCLEAIPHFLQPQFQPSIHHDASSPVCPRLKGFPLVHRDLNNCNILYNDNFKIVGVIDWTAVSTLPWESFLLPPCDFPCMVVFQEERALYIDVFERVEKERNGKVLFAEYMRSKAARIAEMVNMYVYNFPEPYAERLTQLLYGDDMTWEQVKEKCREWLKSHPLEMTN